MRGLDGSAHLSLLEREGHLLEIASKHTGKSKGMSGNHGSTRRGKGSAYTIRPRGNQPRSPPWRALSSDISRATCVEHLAHQKDAAPKSSLGTTYGGKVLTVVNAGLGLQNLGLLLAQDVPASENINQVKMY